jgi:hypothetical protein
VVAVVTSALLVTAGWAGADDAPKPAIAGLAQVGETLTASADFGTEAPTAVAWQWLRCQAKKSTTCGLIGGATTKSYRVAAADVGSRLRVRLTVTGQDGKPKQTRSDPTAVVTVPPPPPPTPPTPTPTATPTPTPTPDPPAPEPSPVPATPQPAVSVPRLLHPFPTIRIRGALTRTGARVTMLSVRAPKGVRISVRCRGRSCPTHRLAMAAAATRLHRFERVLQAGTRLQIKVTKPGFIGKWSVITIRRGRPPARSDRCVLPGGRRPVRCPAS